ncbi:MAG TPA: cbb3-type cytochrome c oxidase N-terminal domain-containing protein [Vicinamibacterales bacterium]
MERKADELLEHEADGIREFDNQLPRWWLYGFYFTIAFAAAYLVNYHVLPNPLFGKAGMIAEYEAEVEAAERVAASRPKPELAVTTAATDPESLRKGEEIFNSQTSVCYSCHRPDLGGLVGPNLTDDLWLHGCTITDVMTSIRTGYPQRGMLPFGSNSPLTDEELLQVASFILSKRGSNPENPKPPDPERDKNCQ